MDNSESNRHDCKELQASFLQASTGLSDHAIVMLLAKHALLHRVLTSSASAFPISISKLGPLCLHGFVATHCIHVFGSQHARGVPLIMPAIIDAPGDTDSTRTRPDTERPATLPATACMWGPTCTAAASATQHSISSQHMYSQGKQRHRHPASAPELPPLPINAAARDSAWQPSTRGARRL